MYVFMPPFTYLITLVVLSCLLGDTDSRRCRQRGVRKTDSESHLNFTWTESWTDCQDLPA